MIPLNVCPECVMAQHQNCTGTYLDDADEAWVSCDCFGGACRRWAPSARTAKDVRP